MVLDIYGVSDIGCVRKLNEDSFYICGFKSGAPSGFCVLSDGMGGHNAGEVASQNVVKFIADELTVKSAGGECVWPKVINDAVTKTNEKIYKMAESNQGQSGMGATLVAAVITEKEAYIANVGDSRAYAYRERELMQITRDHSIVEEMLANGSITKEEARVHPQRNVITRAMGTDIITEPDIFEYEYMPGDCLLICSDGLSGMITDEEMIDIISEELSAKDTANKLIDAAKEKGGTDNITVIFIRFTQEV